jgi:hypothetical protein
MERTFISLKEELQSILPEVLIKDLQDNERICTTCNGLGVIAIQNPYGIKGDNSPEAKLNRFPYNHQALTLCPNCYNGVQRVCKYCGQPIKKGSITNCDCPQYVSEQETILKNKWKETVNKAQKVTEEEVKTMLYCEEQDKYFNSIVDFFEYWESEYDEKEKMPEVLWVTEEVKLSFDAGSILESACEELHEDAYDNCSVDELQEFLDQYVEKQTGTTTYYPCFKQYVVIKKDYYK